MCIHSLKADEREYAVELIDQIIEKRRRLPYEDDMLTTIAEGWIAAQRLGVEKARAYIEAVQTSMTHDDIVAMVTILRANMGLDLAVGLQEELIGLFTKSYTVGKAVAESIPAIKVSFGLADKTAINWLTEHHLYWIGNYFDKNLSANIANTVAEGMAQGLGRKEIGSMLSNFFEDYPGVPIKPLNYWRGLAATATRRSQSFGILGGLDEVGFKEYIWVTAEDERVCDICLEMDGKTFSVAAAMNQRQQLINATDPEDVKQITPWPSLDEIVDKSNAELQMNGIGMPPIHGSCRCDIVVAT